MAGPRARDLGEEEEKSSLACTTMAKLGARGEPLNLTFQTSCTPASFSPFVLLCVCDFWAEEMNELEADPRAVHLPDIYMEGCGALAFGGCRARQGISVHVPVVQDVGAGVVAEWVERG